MFFIFKSPLFFSIFFISFFSWNSKSLETYEVESVFDVLDKPYSILKRDRDDLEGTFCFDCDLFESKRRDITDSLLSLADKLSSFQVMKTEGSVNISFFSKGSSCNESSQQLFEQKDDFQTTFEKSRPFSYTTLLADQKRDYKVFFNFCLKW